MVSNHKEALELCKEYGVDISVHPTTVVTSTGNIYLTDNVDPKDKGEKFYMNTEEVTDEEVKPKKTKK